MKRLFALVFISLACSTMAYGKTDGLKHSITVSKFKNMANWDGNWNLSSTFGALLTDSLRKTEKFIVLGEQDMRKEAIHEQDFGASGRVAGGKKTPQIGHMTPAQLLVKGEITHYQHSTNGLGGGLNIGGFNLGAKTDHAEINAVIYVVDSTTGQVVASKKVVGSASRTGLDIGFSDIDWGVNLDGFKKTNVGKAVEEAIDEAVDFIVAQTETIPWTGSIILVKGSRIYINRGSREGVSPGQRFIVGRSQVLRDPDTGELLEETMDQVGMLEVVSLKDKTSICRSLSGASAVSKGMRVMPSESQISVQASQNKNTPDADTAEKHRR